MALQPYINYNIVDLAALQQRLHHWRAVGGKVVFTNGCFDILHQGHIELLTRCRDFGDYIVVGLNADASLKRLKGAGRPVNNQQARAAVLAALRAVDAVIIFEEDTPLELITHILPDVLVKGGDYTATQIVGADVVKLNGGEVKIVPFVEGFSTTGIIYKMNR